jgi:hypothetical protein
VGLQEQEILGKTMGIYFKDQILIRNSGLRGAHKLPKACRLGIVNYSKIKKSIKVRIQGQACMKKKLSCSEYHGSKALEEQKKIYLDLKLTKN